MSEHRASARQRGYTWRWEKARATYLKHHPLCVMCLALGRTVAATIVDHIIPHRGDQALFWDVSNWQSLCMTCHSAHKQSLERGGVTRGCDANGVPYARNAG